MSGFRIATNNHVIATITSTSEDSVGATSTVIGKVLLGNSSANDAFGRLRTSNPVTLFESSMEVDEQPLLWNTYTQNSGATSYNTNQSSVTLSVASATASSQAIRQSISYTRYQPGKSLLVLLTFLFGSGATGVTKRVGYFDTQNGIFLQQLNGQLSIGLRTYTSGSVVTTLVDQDNWNIDKFDGTGFSGLTFDSTKTYILAIDLEWLGVGRVRVGFVVAGKTYYIHHFDNTEQTTVYMTRASLPVRYEITSDSSGTNAAGSLTQICSTVISEGGYVPKGIDYARSTESKHTLPSSGAMTPVIAIRLKTAYAKSILYPTAVNIASITNDFVNVIVVLRPTLTGGSWSSASTAVEYNETATSYTGGYVITSDYSDQKSSVQIHDIGNNIMIAGADITATTTDVILVAARSLSGSNADVYISIGWREIY